jgi:CHAT domain-containing protein
VQLLSDVPFATLRRPNSLVGEGYLIQSHTISVTPSLRILQQCNERLKELDQDVLPDTSIGTIIAIGNPAYREFPQNHNKATGNLKMFQTRLEGTGEEVEFIEELFGKEHVVKLTGIKATRFEVLKWAKYPSENGVKQVVFHIAAHGIGQDDNKNVKKGAIILVSPPSPFQQNYGKLGISTFLMTSKANMLTLFYMYMVGCHTQIDYHIFISKKIVKIKCAMVLWMSIGYGYYSM